MNQKTKNGCGGENALFVSHDSHYSHSRQFRSNIKAEEGYWKKVREICEGTGTTN